MLVAIAAACLGQTMSLSEKNTTVVPHKRMLDPANATQCAKILESIEVRLVDAEYN